GFPGETDEDFEQTLKVVEEVGFDGAFTFIYSKREGTPAAAMEQVDPEEAKGHFDSLLKLLEKIGRENNARRVGMTATVLAEEVSKNDAGFLSGRTEHNHLVHFRADASRIGTLCRVKITSSGAFYLLGELQED
ncbi:MAG: TRAM domain-containing protein, partial [Lachnospiraceae bacterium]|nr:TRAM domain-containing protein [Lachnospiraceae bacterium]